MSKATRKALALGAGAALGLSSLVALPAQAGAFNVDIAYTSGSKASIFNADEMSIDITQAGLIDSTIAATAFAIVISNPDSINLQVDFTGTGAVGAETFSVLMVDANGGVESAAGQTRANDGIAEGNNEALTFATGDAVLAVLYDFEDNASAPQVPDTIQISRAAADDDYGDDGASISLYAYYDQDLDFTDPDNSGASETLNVTFVDPATVSAIVKLQRVVGEDTTFLNAAGDADLVGTLQFSNSTINLDTIDLGDWVFDVDTDGADDNDQDTSLTVDETAFGYDDWDDWGKALLQFDVDANLAVDKTYRVRTSYEAADTREFTSNGFQVVKSTSLADDVAIAVTEDENAYEVALDATESRVRTGSTGTEFTVTADVADANIPVVITVTATVGTVSIAGAGAAEEGHALLWNTLTNADGEVVFTVVSSAEAGDDYTIDAYIIEDDGTSATSDEDVNVEDAAPTTWETNSTVLTGLSLTLSATVLDQFGEAISDDDGDAISVGFTATDTDNLEKYVAVVKGTASVTFTNWLDEGDSDTITVNAFTGDSDAQTVVAGLTDISVTLYADLAVAGIVTTAAEYDAVVGYSDFGADVDAADGTAATVAGTVIDSVGAGVPGAQVTITGAGLQFNEGTDWAVGSHTFSADEAGAFSVAVYTHVADDVEVTISSGGKSTTVTIAGDLDKDGANSISASNLLLSWNLPATLMYNTTYRVDATVTDVWGNPIAGAEVTFAGEAAAEFNGAASIAKDTNASGVATAYLRSLADVSGLAAVSATLSDNINLDADADVEINTVGDTFTDDEDTSWDESAATDLIAAEVTFLTVAPVAATDAKVNVGSFNGKLVVYAKNLDGKRISWKVGGNWGKAVAVGNDLNRFDRLTPRKGVTLTVDIYVDGVKTLTKSVVTR